MQSPILSQLKSSVGEHVRIVKIDIDKNQQLSTKLGVSSIPTIMIFQNGELKWQGVGIQTKQTLEAQINALAST
jgi:thioredoxin 1